MDFAFSKELEMIRKAAREFAEKEIAPFADEWDRQHYLPIKEVVRKMGELGFLGTVIPEAYGGEDMGWMATAVITEADIPNCLRKLSNRGLCPWPHSQIFVAGFSSRSRLTLLTSCARSISDASSISRQSSLPFLPRGRCLEIGSSIISCGGEISKLKGPS